MDSTPADSANLTFGVLTAPLMSSSLKLDHDVVCLSTAQVFQLLSQQAVEKRAKGDEPCDVFKKVLKYSKRFGSGIGQGKGKYGHCQLFTTQPRTLF